MITRRDFRQVAKNNMERSYFYYRWPYMFAFRKEVHEDLCKQDIANTSSLIMLQHADYAWMVDPSRQVEKAMYGYRDDYHGYVIKDRGGIFSASTKKDHAEVVYERTYARPDESGINSDLLDRFRTEFNDAVESAPKTWRTPVIGQYKFGTGDIVTGKDRSYERSIYRFDGVSIDTETAGLNGTPEIRYFAKMKFIALTGAIGGDDLIVPIEQLKEYRVATDYEIRVALMGRPYNPMANSMLDDFRPSVNPPNGNPCAEIKLEQPKPSELDGIIDALRYQIGSGVAIIPEKLAPIIQNVPTGCEEDHGPCPIEPVAGPVCKLCGKREQEGVNYHDHWCPRGKEQA